MRISSKKDLESFSLPISLIRQHLFCPRIPYFYEVLGLKTSPPSWTTQGNKYHKKQILLSKRRTLSRYDLQQGEALFEVDLVSYSAEIHGRCDAVIKTHEEIVPIEFKLSKKISKSHIYQVIGYAIAAEDFFNLPCQIAFILNGPKAKPKLIEITMNLKTQFYQLTKKIKENLEKEIIPESSANSHQCGQCEFINFCNDRF